MNRAQSIARAWRPSPYMLEDIFLSGTCSFGLTVPNKDCGEIGRKINLENVMAPLNTPCPKCGYSIPPNETQRVSFTEMRCPKCNAVFVAGEKT
jgi:ribosomal protein S27AE